MKRFYLSMLVICLLAVSVVSAQTQSQLTCGDTVSEQFFNDDLLHTYSVSVESGMRLIVHGDPLPLNDAITLDIEVKNRNGGIIGANTFAPEDGIATLETDALLAGGDYEINVTGNRVGAYQLFVSCVTETGEVISNNNLVQPLDCGQQVDNTMIRPDELHRYYLYLEDGIVMDVFLEALYGDFSEMTFEMGLYSPTNQELNRLTADFRGIESQILEQNITTTGIYRLYAQGFDSTDEDYRIAVDCTLPDGNLAISGGESRRVLEPTVLASVASSAPPPPTNDTNTSPPIDLPDVLMPPVNLALIDLIEGIPNTGQLTMDQPMVGYRFEANADEMITLNYTRVRGTTPLMMWVRGVDGDILFSSQLDITDTLSALLRMPDAGEYQVILGFDMYDPVVFTVEIVRGE